MMSRRANRLASPAVAALIALGSTACASQPPEQLPDPDAGPPSRFCEPGDYVPFEADAFTRASAAAAAHAAILEAVDLAEVDPATAADSFASVAGSFEALRPTLAAARDVRLDGAPEVGAALAAEIDAAIADGKAATSASQVGLVRERIDTALLRGLALEALARMSRAERADFDEAVATLGCPVDNREDGRQAVCRMATEIDAVAATSWAEVTFGAVKDAQCELDGALAAPGSNLTEYRAIHGRVAAILAKAFATGAALAVSELPGKPDDSAVRDLLRAKGLFAFIEPVMAAAPAQAEPAAFVRSQFAAADAAVRDGTAGWSARFDAAGVRQRLEAAWGFTLPRPPE